MNFIWEDLVKLLVALALGGIIGAERERHKKAVGLRTLILISVGSALFTIISTKMVGPSVRTLGALPPISSAASVFWERVSFWRNADAWWD
jgi:putative Mg2+ transporter-C (MgtC) family protein